MANLKEIRVRLASIKSTRQITSAMKMVSAAKLRKAQDAILQMRPYANKLQEILVNLTASIDEPEDNIYGTVRDVKRALIVLVSSNKGLCGAFNANVAKEAIRLIENDYAELRGSDSIHVLAIGKKAGELLRSKKYNVHMEKHELFDSHSYDGVAEVAESIMKAFAEGEYDEVKIIYNQFRNAATQDLTVEQYLPIAPQVEEEEEEEDIHGEHETTRVDYILEPSREYIVRELIPKSLKIQLYKAFLDSNASEHGARMTAMHKATDNATELIKNLQLEYNKARQASITKEILEIVGGAEALSS